MMHRIALMNRTRIAEVLGRGQKKRGRKRKVGQGRGAHARLTSAVSVSTLLEAKKLVDTTGSIESVRQALKALEKLR
jgi:hypothetical protein